MSISNNPKKINKFIEFTLILILMLLLAFALGAITLGMTAKSPITIKYPQEGAGVKRGEEKKAEKGDESNGVNKPLGANVIGAVVASKKGKKYHLPWCAGAKAILAENKITFENPEAAQKAGYGPAKNCKGLIPK